MARRQKKTTNKRRSGKHRPESPDSPLVNASPDDTSSIKIRNWTGDTDPISDDTLLVRYMKLETPLVKNPSHHAKPCRVNLEAGRKQPCSTYKPGQNSNVETVTSNCFGRPNVIRLNPLQKGENTTFERRATGPRNFCICGSEFSFDSLSC